MNEPPVSAADDRTQVAALFARYIDAWNAGDFHQIGADIYQTPVYVYETGTTSALETPEAIVGLLSGLRKELNASGFTHSTLEHVATCDLGNGLMFATFHYRRYFSSATGQSDDVLASAYILRKYAAGWRLAAHVFQSTLDSLAFVVTK